MAADTDTEKVKENSKKALWLFKKVKVLIS